MQDAIMQDAGRKMQDAVDVIKYKSHGNPHDGVG
jgi:hypothetical protein